MGFRSAIRTRQPILTALSKGIPQGRRGLDREGAVYTKKALSRRERALETATLRCPGLRCVGLGLRQDPLACRPVLNLLPKASFRVRNGGRILGVDSRFCGLAPLEKSIKIPH